MNRTMTMIAGAAAALTLACSGDNAREASEAPSAVTVTTSSPVTERATVTYPASVVAVQEANVATRTSGTIREIRVDVGTRVRTGDTLAVLLDDDMKAAVRGAEAEATLARSYFERVRALAEDGAASDDELDRARAGFEGAEAVLAGRRAEASYAALTAPFDGVVTRRFADAGDLAAPGRPVLALTGHGRVKITADLPERALADVRVGQVVRVALDAGASEARVTRVVPAVDRSTRRFRVEAELLAGGASGVVPGSFARLEIERGSDSVIWLPADAVVRDGQLYSVFVVETDVVRRRWIRPGVRKDDAVEMLAGPGTDARVVRRPSAELVDGAPVESARAVPWAPAGSDGEVSGR